MYLNTTISEPLSATPVATNSLNEKSEQQAQAKSNNKITPRVKRLNDTHYKECVEKRGLDPEWIRANCESFNKKQASERLGYPAKSEGIWLEGANGFGQYRPNQAWKSEEDKANKKPAPKYRTATGEETDAILPAHPTNRQYWEDLAALEELCWKIDGKPCIVITEGVFTALAPNSHGIPTIALTGVWQGFTKKDWAGRKHLVETLYRFADTGKFGFIIIFDADANTNKNIVAATRELAHGLSKAKVPVYIGTGLWNESEGKGMDDFIQKCGVDRFKREVMGKVVDLRTWEKQFTSTSEGEGKKKGSKHAELFRLMQDYYGEDLAWNELKKQIEYKGERFLLEGARTRVALDLDIDASVNAVEEVFVVLAKQHCYNPVTRYLESLPQGDPKILDDLAERYLECSGTAYNGLYNVLLKKTLIAAVARAFKPGCKHDNICILKGEQGALKSSFWEVLAGKEFFSDDITSGTEKDEVLKLSQDWILEYSEFETAYNKKDQSQLKSFLARKIDKVRVPYGRDIEDMKRPSILVGTSNKNDFLRDGTGERRFWVIPLPNDEKWEIDIESLKAQRDSIWAAAVTLYKQGEQWWLTKDEDAQLKKSNLSFKESDTWADEILAYIERHHLGVTTAQILVDCLKLDLSRTTKSDESRVTRVLQEAGWVKGNQQRVNGKRVRLWKPKSAKKNLAGDTLNSGVVTEVVTEVVTPSTPETAKVLSEVSPASPAFLGKTLNQEITQQPLVVDESDKHLEENRGGDSDSGDKLTSTPDKTMVSERHQDVTNPQKTAVTSEKIKGGDTITAQLSPFDSEPKEGVVTVVNENGVFVKAGDTEHYVSFANIQKVERRSEQKWWKQQLDD